MRIAILEDDREQSDVMTLWLEEEGHDTVVFGDANRFMSGIKNESYDVLILDWMLPQSSGLDVLKWLREELNRRTPVLFLTSRDDENSIVEALESGADDYVIKPVTDNVLNARVKALIRRAGLSENDEPLKVFGRFSVDFDKRVISFDGQPFELTNKEYELSAFLFRNAGKVVSRAHILQSVWGSTADIATRKVDTHISRLRSKLAIREENGWRIVSVYQHGYRLESTS